MRLKPIFPILSCLLICASFVANAQSKKEMKEAAKQPQTEEELLLAAKTRNEPGYAEYEKGMAALQKGNDKSSNKLLDKANKLLDEACDKGYNPACIELWSMYHSSENQRNEAIKKCAENGDSLCMYNYAYYLSTRNDEVVKKSAEEWFARSAAAGYRKAVYALGTYYEDKKLPTYDSVKAVELYQYFADKGDTTSLEKLLTLQNNNKEAIYDLAEAYKVVYLKAPSTNGWWKTLQLFKQSCNLGNPAGCYQTGVMDLYETNSWGGHTGGGSAKYYFELAAKMGYNVPVEDIAKAESYISHEDAASKFSDNKPKMGTIQQSTNTVITKPATTETRKTCPICNGSGKIYDTYTTENRDWKNKTITMTDHKTTKTCSRCNGKGYYSY